MAKKLQLHGSFPSKAGENGGFYTPNVSQPNPETLMFAFEKSKEDMPTVPPVAFPLMKGADGKDGKDGDNRVDAYATLKPSFAWIDDDGKEKVSHLFQWAQTNNVPFTSALISGWIAEGKKGWMSVEQVKALHDSGLVTFASHTQNHVKLSDVNRETVEAELKNSKEQIESWGVPCEVMVYPNGAINDTDFDIVHKYFPFGFLASGQYDDNNIPNTNRVNTCPISTYKLMRVDVRGDYTEENGGIAYVKGQIDDAIAKNGLLVLMSHVGSTVIYDENGNATNTYLDASADLAVYTEILEYIRGKGYDIEPLMDVCERFANPVDVKDFVVGADGTVQVSKGNVHVVADYNAYTMASLPSQYPQNQITTCQIYDTTAPGASTGILTAYVTDTLAYRTYMPKISATLYLQIKNPNADAWMDWSKCNQKDYTKLSNNKILSTTAPSALPSGVSICVVASSADIPNLPEGVAGMMTAYNLFSGADKAYEEWKPTGSANKYIRYATSASTWSDWYGGTGGETPDEYVTLIHKVFDTDVANTDTWGNESHQYNNYHFWTVDTDGNAVDADGLYLRIHCPAQTAVTSGELIVRVGQNTPTSWMSWKEDTENQPYLGFSNFVTSGNEQWFSLDYDLRKRTLTAKRNTGTAWDGNYALYTSVFDVPSFEYTVAKNGWTKWIGMKIYLVSGSLPAGTEIMIYARKRNPNKIPDIPKWGVVE